MLTIQPSLHFLIPFKIVIQLFLFSPFSFLCFSCLPFINSYLPQGICISSAWDTLSPAPSYWSLRTEPECYVFWGALPDSPVQGSFRCCGLSSSHVLFAFTICFSLQLHTYSCDPWSMSIFCFRQQSPFRNNGACVHPECRLFLPPGRVQPGHIVGSQLKFDDHWVLKMGHGDYYGGGISYSFYGKWKP